MVLDIRNKAKVDKNFSLSDEIRNKLTDAGVQIKDGKEGASWKI
jgi:cysteinyl-tRNA synthetase